MPVSFPSRQRGWAALLLCAALSACTGTEETGRAFNLVVQDGNTALRRVSVPDTGTPSALAPVTTTGRVTDVATVEAGALLGVTFPDRLELRGADAATPVRTIGARVPAGTPGVSPAPDYDRNGVPDYLPCYRQVEPNQSGTRLALFSDIGASNELGCAPGGREQWVALYESNGTLLFNALLPAPITINPEDVHLAVVGSDLYVARRVGALDVSEIRRVRADSNPNDGVIRAEQDPPLNTNAPLIRDLAVLNGALYVATDGGVRTLSASGALSDAPVAGFTMRADRLWTAPNILAAWNNDPLGSAGTLTLRYRSGNGFAGTLTLTGLQTLRDLVFGPDGYLYVILSGSVQRYDLTGLASGNIRAPSPQAVPAGVQGDARAAAYVIP